MKKRISCILVLLLFLIVVVFCSCTSTNNINTADDNGEISEDIGETDEGGEIKFDVSEYSDYGNVSCGRLWVETFSKGDWDDPSEEVFAYFDTEGNKLTEWFSSEEWEKSDYEDDYLVLSAENRLQAGYDASLWLYKIIDINGKTVDEVAAKDLTDNNSDGQRLVKYAEGVDSDTEITGGIFGSALITADSVGWIDSTGVHKLEMGEQSLFSIDEEDNFFINTENGYYVLIKIDKYLGADLALVFDSHKNYLLDLSDAIGYTPHYAVVNTDDEVEADFYGANRSLYSCKLDLDGNFIKKPYEVE